TARGELDLPPAHEHADQTQPGPDLPHAASGLADVAQGHAVKAVLARLEHHPLQAHPALGLVVSHLGDHGARAREPREKRVTDPLELTQVQQPGLTWTV